MKELQIRDEGGMAIHPNELRTEDFIGYVSQGLENLNTTLGTPDDPDYGQYTAFLNGITSAQVVTIDAEHIHKGSFSDIEFDGVQRVHLTPEFTKSVEKLAEEIASPNFFFFPWPTLIQAPVFDLATVPEGDDSEYVGSVVYDLYAPPVPELKLSK